MTRRFSGRYKLGRPYRLQRDWYHYLDEQILITRKFRECLGDISEEDVWKEGYETLEEFKKAWKKINGYWDAEQAVWVYEFKVIKEE